MRSSRTFCTSEGGFDADVRSMTREFFFSFSCSSFLFPLFSLSLNTSLPHFCALPSVPPALTWDPVYGPVFDDLTISRPMKLFPTLSLLYLEVAK